MGTRTLILFAWALIGMHTGVSDAQATTLGGATPTTNTGVARANAEKIDMGVRTEQRLDALPIDVKRDLVRAFESEKTNLAATRQRAANALKAKPSEAARVHLDSVTSRFAAVSDDSLFVTNSIVEPAVSTPGATATPNKWTYRPEYLLPSLNPTFAMCGDGVWNRPGFVYQAQVDKNATALKQIALAVGLFKTYTQRSQPGLPAPTDLILAAAGTGIAIGPDLVLTNQHVAANMVLDPTLAPSNWQLNSAKQRFIIWFPVETSACVATAKSAAFEVVQLAYAGLGPTYNDDIAVLKVRPLSGAALQPVAFAETASYSGDQYLGVIGYPDRPDPADYVPPTGNGLFPNNAQLEAYFDLPNSQLPKYQIERFGFGTLVDLNDPDKRIIGHDAPTDNSSSGSLVVALDTGKPIALHAGGNLGAGRNSGVNIAYRSDYVLTQLRAHGLLVQP
jgi:hypothetical protein